MIVSTEVDLECEELIVVLQRAGSGRHVDRVEFRASVELISHSTAWQAGHSREYEFELPAQDLASSFESDGFRFGWRLSAWAKFAGGGQVETTRELKQALPAGAHVAVWPAVPARPDATGQSSKGCILMMVPPILLAGSIVWLGLHWGSDILAIFGGLLGLMFCGTFVMVTRDVKREGKVGQAQVHCENVEVSGYRSETAQRLACSVWLHEKEPIQRVDFELRVFWKEYRHDGVKRRPAQTREVILYREQSEAQRDAPGKWSGELPLPPPQTVPCSLTLSDGVWRHSKNRIGALWELRTHIVMDSGTITETRSLVSGPSEKSA